MTIVDLVSDILARVGQGVHRAVEPMTPESLLWRPDPAANSVAWLVWHLTRVQDSHIAELAGTPQVWLGQGWVDRFGLDLDRDSTGYGHTPEQVAAVRAPADLLLGYYDATAEVTAAYLRRLTEEDLDVVVDTSWNPPVTLGVRLVSLLSDDLQHAGQAGYVRGLAERAAR